MQLSDLKNRLRNYPVFSTRDLQLFDKVSKHTLETQISNWVKKGELIQLKKGLYCFNPKISGAEISKLVIANKLYEPSYISLEYALSYYGIIPDVVFQITSITNKKTSKFENKLGIFYYHHVKSLMFFGFHQKKISNNVVLIADKEKALIDYLYINLNRIEPKMKYLKELRLQNVKQLGKTKLGLYARATHKIKIMQVIELLKKYDELD
ncbi:MAG: type IV toxin-antitoxin system AbiEi family antitoxin domain-containing protein [Patescibacteria group bacterium]